VAAERRAPGLASPWNTSPLRTGVVRSARCRWSASYTATNAATNQGRICFGLTGWWSAAGPALVQEFSSSHDAAPRGQGLAALREWDEC